MNDLISRQAAIDELHYRFDDTAESWKEMCDLVIDALKDLPSAQTDVVRCKDCKNSEHWYRDRRRCFLWSEGGVSVFDDGFCNYAQYEEGKQDG